MNVKQLICLAAIVLGGMTSCSNILEEDGVANTITKGETGELRLNLVTDGTLNVTTKSTTSISLPVSDYGNFKITGTKVVGSDSKDVALGCYSDYTENKSKTVEAGTYSSIKGSNGEMESTLGWDCPKFSGVSSTPFTVSAQTATAKETSLTANLTNSVITVNEEKLGALKNAVSISALFVYAGTKYTEPEPNSKFDLLDLLNATKTLFVKAEATNVYIWLKGTHQQTGTPISLCTQIKDQGESTTATSGKKSYSVAYDLKQDQGELKLTIEIAGDADIVTIPETIDPYPNN